MPMNERIPFDADRAAPYWMPQESLGTYIHTNSSELRAWWVAHPEMHDDRPVLRKIINTSYELGLDAGGYSDNRRLLTVYLPRIDRLMLEQRSTSGDSVITTSIYSVDTTSSLLLWLQDDERRWVYNDSDLRLVTPTYDVSSAQVLHHFHFDVTPRVSDTIIFHQGDWDGRARLMPQPVDPVDPVETITAHTVRRFGITDGYIVNQEAHIMMDRINRGYSYIELGWFEQSLDTISNAKLAGWSISEGVVSYANNYMMRDPNYRELIHARWCDRHQLESFLSRGWVPVTQAELSYYGFDKTEIVDGTLEVYDLIPDGSQSRASVENQSRLHPERVRTTRPEGAPMPIYITNPFATPNGIYTTSTTNGYVVTTSTSSTAGSYGYVDVTPMPVPAGRDPLPNEFALRIAQPKGILGKYQHAVHILSVHRVQVNNGYTLTYTDEEVRDARVTLVGFFERMLTEDRMLSQLVENGDKHTSKRVDRAMTVIYRIQNVCRTYRSRTDFYALSSEHRRLRIIADECAKQAIAVVNEALLGIVMTTGIGEFVLNYALESGMLADRHNMRASDMQRAISSIFSHANDRAECEVILNDNDISQCEDCREWELDEEFRDTYLGNDNVCRRCITNNYIYSSYYEQYIYQNSARTAYDRYGNEVTVHCDDDDFEYDDDTDEYYHVDYERRNGLIRDYHSAKRRGFKFVESDWVKRNDRYMGVELEIECRNDRYDAVDKLNDALNDGTLGKMVWFENDGSLSDSGFEMITNPMGLDTHADLWDWLQDNDLTKGLRSHDTSTCGLHVHVSRKNLHDLQINRMNVFINHPDNAALIKAVARRYATNYARIRAKQMGKAHHVVDRYDAINLENDSTIEFRIFKGTLKHESLMAALEFTNAVVNFTNPGSPAGFNLSTERFMRFIDSPAQRGETRFLRSYLKDAGFVS